MSTTLRKKRKRAGIQFTKEPKVGTPLEERVLPLVTDRAGRISGPLRTHVSNRAVRKLVNRIIDRAAWADD